MSRKLPDLKAKEVVLALQRAGFAKWRQKGSHLTMFRPDDRRALTVPMHFSKSVPKGTLYTIIRSSGISVDEFRRLLK
jgi:predicted RNA binding protein YcfA (HicA-like mRNA interferase family)